MTYTCPDEVPFNIRRCYSPEDLIQWMTEYNAAMASLEDGTLQIPDSRLSKATYAREIAFNACKVLPSSRYVRSVATTEVIDRQNEKADIDSYFDAMYDFVENGGGTGIDSHSSKNASMIWKFEKGIDEKTGQPAIIIYENYYRGTKLYDKVWKAVLDGFLGEKSIGSRIDSEKSHFECDSDGCYNRIYADQIFEISSVMRGANPRTYIIDKHIAEKGSNINTYITEVNNTKTMCTLKENYLNFKNEIESCSPDAIVHYLPNGSIYIKGYMSGMERAVRNYYPDRYMSEPTSIPGLGDDFTFITKLKGEFEVNLVFDEVMRQIDGERDAIEGYNGAIRYINDVPTISEDVKENVSNILREIIGDEQKHIGSLYQALKVICPRIKENLHDGKEEAKEIVEKSDEVSPCPEGQHEHAGVVGCHDETRDHSGQGSETLPNTGESSQSQISVNEMSTEQLLSNLTAMRDTLNNYSSEQVRQFLATQNGKVYIQMYLELKSRSRASDNSEGKKMSEIVEKSDLVEKSDKAEVALKEDVKEAEVKTVAAPSETAADVTGTPDVTETPAPIPESANGADKTAEGEMPGAIPEAVSGSSEIEDMANGGEALKSDSDLPTAVANISSILVYLKAKIDTFDARLSGLEDMTKMNSTVNDAGIPNPIAEAAAPIGAMAQQIAQPEPVVAGTDAKADVPVADTRDETGEEPAKEENAEEGKPTEVPPEEKSEGDAPKEEEPKSEEGSNDSEGQPEEKKDEEKPSEEPKPAESKPEEKSEDDKKKDIKEKSDDLTLEDYLAMSAFEKRQVELRMKGIEVTEAQGNPESITSVGATIKAEPGVSIVETPAPAPFTPAPAQSENYSFDKVMQDMEQMSNKQFRQQIFKGEISQ